MSLAQPAQGSVLTGIGLKVLSVAIFVAMQALIKAAGDLPVGQIIFFRAFFAMLPILVFLAYRREIATALSTSRPLAHVSRGLIGVASMGLGFFALSRLPLPEVITLNYAQPLLLVVFSALFMGETIRIYRWSAVAVGMIGVFIVSWPKLTLFTSQSELSNHEAMGIIAMLTAAAMSASALLMVRNLVQTERSATIVMWFSLTASVAGLLSLPLGWSPLTAAQAGLLIGSGICGGVAQIVMTEAYRHAEASTVAPFEYMSLLIGVAVGYFAFQEVPTIHMLVGGLIVIAAGIFIIWRERQLGIERAAVRKVTPPQ
ncbi:MAG: DMT family transporter [Rhizobiaceae bacterium]